LIGISGKNRSTSITRKCAHRYSTCSSVNCIDCVIFRPSCDSIIGVLTVCTIQIPRRRCAGPLSRWLQVFAAVFLIVPALGGCQRYHAQPLSSPAIDAALVVPDDPSI